MTPLFSIIIPVYNVEQYLRKCLDSVLNQTCRDWECICVDDGSTDGSGKILDEYFKKVEKAGGGGHWTILHQKNGGVSAARNAALDLAKGEWVQFLDSDDSLELDFLEKLAEAIQTNPRVDAIEHTAIYCYDGGRKVYGIGGVLPPSGVVPAQQILSDPFGEKYTDLARCSCYKIFRRRVVEQQHLRFINGMPLGEDTLFAVEFYAYAGDIAICPKVAGYCRVFRAGSAIKTISAEKLIPCLYQMEKLHNVWMVRPSRGLAIALSASILRSMFLGVGHGKSVRSKCIESVLSSCFFNRVGLPFLFWHGTFKMRVFSFFYRMSPCWVRRIILERI